MKKSIIALILFAYISGCCMTYKLLKYDLVENYGVEWTKGKRNAALLLSLPSWFGAIAISISLTLDEAKTNNEPAKW